MTLPVMHFAAGLGTRMGALSKDRPKPLIKVAGRPLLDHALALSDSSVFRPRVVNVHHFADMVTAHIGRTDAQISDETGQLLETGGGLKKALPLLGQDTVATLNSDAVWKGPNPLEVLQSAWQPNFMTALLLLVPHDQAHGHTGQGDFQLADNGALTWGGQHIYTGAQILKTGGLTDISDVSFSLKLYWEKIVQAGGLYGVVYSGSWCDVGQPSSIPIAEAMLANDV